MRFEHKERENILITQNTFLGTAEYISPEVLFNNDVGPECDLWAVGNSYFQI
jgi:serine/threonine protein kinase